MRGGREKESLMGERFNYNIIVQHVVGLGNSSTLSPSGDGGAVALR